jgi:DNA-binding transcriptional MocR family regulator
LRDPAFPATVERAGDTYTRRRRALIDALAGHGITAFGRSGLNVWVPVREEGLVLRSLLQAGWLVAAGERFRFAAPPGVRIATSTLPEDAAPELAAAVARIERAGTPRRAY